MGNAVIREIEVFIDVSEGLTELSEHFFF